MQKMWRGSKAEWTPGDCSERKWVRRLLSEAGCLFTEELKELKGALRIPNQSFLQMAWGCTQNKWGWIKLPNSLRFACLAVIKQSLQTQRQSHRTNPALPSASTDMSAAVPIGKGAGLLLQGSPRAVFPSTRLYLCRVLPSHQLQADN